jgi:hypothetical protein
LTSALVRGEWSTSRPGPFTSGERVPSTHWIEDWVDPRAGLDDMVNLTFLTTPGLEFRPLGRPASRNFDCAILAPIRTYKEFIIIIIIIIIILFNSYLTL